MKPPLALSPPRARAGFALADVCISLAILVVAMGGLLATVFSALRLSQANESTRAANQAVRGILERMNAVPFDELYATCNSDPADDPVPKSTICLEPSNPLLHDAQGNPAHSEIRFPTAPGAGGLELREDAVDPALGMPRDLNGDGNIDALDHSGDYLVLPVSVRLEWVGPSGAQALEISTLLRDSSG